VEIEANFEDSDSQVELIATELFELQHSVYRFPPHTNVIQHSVKLGAKLLTNVEGKTELAFETKQQDVVILDAEFHLLSPDYEWWSYVSRTELPLRKSDVMDQPCPNHDGKLMKHVVRYSEDVESTLGFSTPEVLLREEEKGQHLILMKNCCTSTRKSIDIFVGVGVQTTCGLKGIVEEFRFDSGTFLITKLRRLFDASDFHESVLKGLLRWQVLVSKKN